MYTVELSCKLPVHEQDVLVGMCTELLNYLWYNNQILHANCPLVVEGDYLRIPVTCPEPDALDRRYCHRNAVHYLDQIQAWTGSGVEFKLLGQSAHHQGYIFPESSSFYILYGESFSPVLCGDTRHPIPLYRLPPLHAEINSYQDFNVWSEAYESLASLWSLTHWGERYALDKLQNVNSELSKAGRDLCRILEERTGIPTYYYLTNRRQWSEQQDRRLKCPLCGEDWLVEGATFQDFIGFKCEKSRLVSHLSSMFRPTISRRKAPKN